MANKGTFLQSLKFGNMGTDLKSISPFEDTHQKGGFIYNIHILDLIRILNIKNKGIIYKFSNYECE